MARGDVVSALESVPSAGSFIFQPAVGVEVLVSEVVLNNLSSSYAEFYNGTLGSVILVGNATRRLGIFMTNSRYLRLNNQAAGAQPLGFTGFQVK